MTYRHRVRRRSGEKLFFPRSVKASAVTSGKHRLICIRSRKTSALYSLNTLLFFEDYRECVVVLLVVLVVVVFVVVWSTFVQR